MNHRPRGVIPRHIRDLLVLESGDVRLVMACDSSGGVGPAPGDMVRASGRTVGLFAARVVLMELLAAGTEPFAVSLAVAGPPSLGHQVRQGVLGEMALVGLGENALVMSTEKNFAVSQTAIGVTALAKAPKGGLLSGGAKAGDRLFVIGLPKVGREVWEGDPEIVDLSTVQSLVRSGLVHDLLPVGSRGIRAESLDLAASAGLRLCWEPRPDPRLDLNKSAGPATALLVALPEAAQAQLDRILPGKPRHHLGILR